VPKTLPTSAILVGAYDEDHSEKVYLIQELRHLVNLGLILESDVAEEVIVVHN